MALPIIAKAAGTAAIAAYFNAKYHIAHDLNAMRLLQAANPTGFFNDCVERKRILTYHFFQAQVRKQPGFPFLIFEGRTWSYKDFFAAFTRVANWLIDDLDIQVDEVVAINGGNSPEYLMLWFALDAIGAVTSFVNCNVTGEGLLHSVKVSNTRLLISDDDIKDNVEQRRAELEGMGINIHYYNPEFFASLSNSTPVPSSRHDGITMESLRSLIFTSGTTGLPKCVVINTGRELATANSIKIHLNLKPGDRMYTCMPLYHTSAHGLCTTPAIHAGSTIVLGRRFSHKTFWPEVATSEANIIQYVGEMCRYLVKSPPNPYERQHKVQKAWGNGMRPDIWERFRERFNIPIINEVYGSTDGLGAMLNPNTGPFTANCIGLRGLLADHIYSKFEARVKMDVDTEEIKRDERGFAIRSGVNEPGQVLHKVTPMIAAAAPQYYRNDDATQSKRIHDVFEKGDTWIQSGDLLRQDSDGRIYFVDRLGDTFRWKSENVSTTEVSDLIGKFPHIAATNVYGVRIPGHEGRAGAASIIMADGVTEATFDFEGLARYAREVLPGYAVPLFLRLTRELEVTGTLKMVKGKLRREGVEPGKVGGGDVVYWLPSGSKEYVRFGEREWEGILEGRLRLG